MGTSESARSSITRPHSTYQPKDADFDGMAIEALVLKRKGFFAARKLVSSKTYYRVWRCFRDWYALQGISFSCSIPRILEFL